MYEVEQALDIGRCQRDEIGNVLHLKRYSVLYKHYAPVVSFLALPKRKSKTQKKTFVSNKCALWSGYPYVSAGVAPRASPVRASSPGEPTELCRALAAGQSRRDDKMWQRVSPSGGRHPWWWRWIGAVTFSGVLVAWHFEICYCVDTSYCILCMEHSREIQRLCRGGFFFFSLFRAAGGWRG